MHQLRVTALLGQRRRRRWRSLSVVFCLRPTLILNVLATALSTRISGVRGERTPQDSDIALGSVPSDSDGPGHLGASWVTRPAWNIPSQGRIDPPRGRVGGKEPPPLVLGSHAVPSHIHTALETGLVCDTNAHMHTEHRSSEPSFLRIEFHRGKR